MTPDQYAQYRALQAAYVEHTPVMLRLYAVTHSHTAGRMTATVLDDRPPLFAARVFITELELRPPDADDLVLELTLRLDGVTVPQVRALSMVHLPSYGIVDADRLMSDDRLYLTVHWPALGLSIAPEAISEAVAPRSVATT